MRQGQHSRRPRARGRRPQNSTNRVFDSNGPEVKVRGTAATVAEKYVSLSHDAHSQGDRVKAENLMQHAEHYLRIAAAAKEQKQPPQPQQSDPSPQAQARAGDNKTDSEPHGEAAKETPRNEPRPRPRRPRPPHQQNDNSNTPAQADKSGTPVPEASGETKPAGDAAPDDAGGVAA